MRHLLLYQCTICGKRFGKRFTKERHEKEGKPCMPGNPDFWVSPELQMAVSKLEKAKEYDTVVAAIYRCKYLSGRFSLHVTQIEAWAKPTTSRPRYGTNTEDPVRSSQQPSKSTSHYYLKFNSLPSGFTTSLIPVGPTTSPIPSRTWWGER